MNIIMVSLLLLPVAEPLICYYCKAQKLLDGTVLDEMCVEYPEKTKQCWRNLDLDLSKDIPDMYTVTSVLVPLSVTYNCVTVRYNMQHTQYILRTCDKDCKSFEKFQHVQLIECTMCARDRCNDFNMKFSAAGKPATAAGLCAVFALITRLF